jgi:hypothetical protein
MISISFRAYSAVLGRGFRGKLKIGGEDISAFAANDDWVLTSPVNGILMKHTSRM